MHLLLLLLLGNDALLLGGEGSPQSAGLLCAEVEGKVLLALVEDAELRALVDVDDGEDTGDGLADVVTVRRKKYPSELVLSVSFLTTPPLLHLSPLSLLILKRTFW